MASSISAYVRVTCSACHVEHLRESYVTVANGIVYAPLSNGNLIALGQ